jgi:glycosyltransferase involved in cell wall biosynthesis
VLKNADRIICVTPPMIDEFVRMHPAIGREKYRVIYNGFDPDDFRGIAVSPQEKFLITFSGIFWSDPAKTPNNFLTAFRALLKEHPELKDDVEVVFMGEFPDKSMELVAGLPVKVLGFVPHDLSIRYILQSSMTLLFLYENEDGRVALATKFLESLGAGKPVLVMGPPDGITSDLMKKEDLGRLVPRDDVVAIKEALYAMYQKYRHTGLDAGDGSMLRQFDRRELTGQLAAVINEVSHSPKA